MSQFKYSTNEKICKIQKIRKSSRGRSKGIDDKIIEAANALIRAIKESGRDMRFVLNGEVLIPVSFDVYVHDHEPKKVLVQHVNNGWEVQGEHKE